MLNFTKNQGEAEIHFGSSDYMILKSGAFVRCAVTYQKIPIDELRYWNSDLQEAYIDAAASLKRWQENNK